MALEVLSLCQSVAAVESGAPVIGAIDVSDRLTTIVRTLA